MTTNYGQQVYSQGTGTASTTLLDAIRKPRNPNAGDNNYPLGKFWVNTQTDAVSYLASLAGNSGTLSANWVLFSSGISTPAIETINDISPDINGNFTIESLSHTIAISSEANGISIDLVGGGATYQADSGGLVSPNVSNTLFISGNNLAGIKTVGNPGTNTITVSSLQASLIQEGTVYLASDAQTIAGTDPNNAVTAASLAAKLGTQTAHSLALFEGSSAALTPLGVATNGQLPIGSTGADPILGNITSTGGTITVTNGAGTINIDVAAGSHVLETLTGNTGGAISPTAGNINTVGTGSITIAGTGSTLTTELTGLTNHAVLVGAGTATITNVGPTATSGQVLQSQGSSTDPAFSTATYPSTTTINQILYSSSSNVVAGLATVDQGILTTGTGGIPVITSIATNGQLIIGSTAGAPAAATLTAGTGIAISNGSNSITISATGSEMVWTDEATSFNAASGNGYFITAGSVIATLPGSPTQGNLISFCVDTTSSFEILANTGQEIRIGSALSASAGTAVNSARGDSVTFVYRSSDSTWIATSVIGTWTVT